MHLYEKPVEEGPIKGIRGWDVWLSWEQHSHSLQSSWKAPGTSWAGTHHLIWAAKNFCCLRHKLVYISDEKRMLRYWTAVLTEGHLFSLGRTQAEEHFKRLKATSSLLFHPGFSLTEYPGAHWSQCILVRNLWRTRMDRAQLWQEEISASVEWKLMYPQINSHIYLEAIQSTQSSNESAIYTGKTFC